MAKINVVDPSTNGVVSVDDADLEAALAEGYRPASAGEVTAAKEQLEYTSGANPLLAGLAGVARGPTLGLSDLALTKTGLVEGETLQKLEKYNPAESLGGEALGIGASLFVPVGGQAAAASGAARAAARTAAQAATAPARLATQAGQAVARAAGAALPEATTALGRIGVAGAQAAAGAATEGALFGAGRALTEYSFGDPSLNGEAVLSHVGLGALLGGGLGGALGMTGAAGAEARAAYNRMFPSAPKVKDVIDDFVPEFGRMGDEMNVAGMSAEERKAWLKRAGTRKADADEIVESSKFLVDDAGNPAPVTDGMLTSSEHHQRIEQGIRNSGTPTGVAIQEEYNKGWNLAAKHVNETLGEEMKDSLATLGRKMKDGISAEFEKRIGPITQLYNEIGQALPNIELGIGSRKAMARSIMKLAESESLTPGMAQYKYLQAIADDIVNVNDLQKLQNWRSALGREVSQENRYIAGVVREKLNDLEYRTIKNSLDLVPEPERRAAIESLIAKIDEAKPAYAALRKDMERVGKNVLGRKKIYGPQDFLDAIEDGKGVESFAKALLKKENSEFMSFMQKEFPNEFNEVVKYHRQQIREAATDKATGLFNPKKAVLAIDELEPEMQAMLFPELRQQQTLGAAKKYLQSFPINFNPSGTSAAEAYQRLLFKDGFWSAVNAAGQEVGQQLQKARISASARPEDFQAFYTLSAAAKKTLNRIKSSAESIFVPDRVRGAIGAKAAEMMLPHEDPEKTIELIKEASNNPEVLIEKLGNGVMPIEGAAPGISQQIQISATRAIQYLAMAAPETKSAYALGSDPTPSKQELFIFNERMRVLKDPASILDEMRTGSLTPDHVDAVKIVYPKLYETMQQEVMAQMIDQVQKKKPINYKTKNMLSLFLGQDLDESITSESILKNQALISKSQAEGQAQDQLMMHGPKVNQKGLGNLSSNAQMMTAMQKSTQRIDRG